MEKNALNLPVYVEFPSVNDLRNQGSEFRCDSLEFIKLDHVEYAGHTFLILQNSSVFVPNDVPITFDAAVSKERPGTLRINGLLVRVKHKEECIGPHYGVDHTRGMVGYLVLKLLDWKIPLTGESNLSNPPKFSISYLDASVKFEFRMSAGNTSLYVHARESNNRYSLEFDVVGVNYSLLVEGA